MIYETRQILLKWYDQQGRQLPWRSSSDQRSDPYLVWLSEIMLQQTTVATVIPYFKKFHSQWPTLVHFANASLEEIRVAWQGLGYYTRAQNMQRCATLLMTEHQGVFPSSSQKLMTLPGIGPYTAAAIASIAFNEAIVPVDGNVLRVMARLFAIDRPLPTSKIELASYAALFAFPERPGDFAQALMDLGATICTPRSPLCESCPLQNYCKAYSQDRAKTLPIKVPKKAKNLKYTTAYIYLNNKNQIALRRRPEKGLLAGLLEIPSSSWQDNMINIDQNLPTVRHIFTHIDLTVKIQKMSSQSLPPLDCIWIDLKDLERYPLPTLTHKIIRVGLNLTQEDLEKALSPPD